MTEEGKILVKGGAVASVDGGAVLIGAGSCDCCDEPPEEPKCTQRYWGSIGVPPEDAEVPWDFSTFPVPECTFVTLTNTPFDGTYAVYPTLFPEIGIWVGTYIVTPSSTISLNRRVQIAQDGLSWEEIVGGGFWSDTSYFMNIEIQFGATPFGGGSVLQGKLLWDNIARVQESSSGGFFTEVFPQFYASGPVFSSESPQKLLVADPVPFFDTDTSILNSDAGNWTMTWDMNFSGKGLEGGARCGLCSQFIGQWIGDEKKVLPTSSSLSDNSWLYQLVYDPSNVEGDTQQFVGPAVGGGGNAGSAVMLDNGAGAAWAREYTSPNPSNLGLGYDYDSVLQSAIGGLFTHSHPTYLDTGWVLEATFNTPAILRNGTLAVGETLGNGGGATGYSLSNIVVNGSYIRIQRNGGVFQTSATTYEIQSYWTLGFGSPFAGALYTQSIPFSPNFPRVEETCLPNTTTVREERLFVRDLGMVESDEFGSVNGLKWGGLLFRSRVFINGILISESENVSTGCSNDGGRNQPPAAGVKELFLSLASGPDRNFGWTRTPAGFDSAAKGGVSNLSLSAIPPRPARNIDSHCFGTKMESKLTPYAEFEDEEAQIQYITFHLNEDIGTHLMTTSGSKHIGPYRLTTLKGKFGESLPLPPGLKWDVSGKIYGTPTTAGEYDIFGSVLSLDCAQWTTWCLRITVKVRNPEFQYDPEGFVSGGTNDQGVDWYLRDGDGGTIEANARWGTTPYTMSYTGVADAGSSFNTGTGDWVLSPAFTQLGNTSGTVYIKLVDDTNKTDFATKTWFRLGGGGPPGP